MASLLTWTFVLPAILLSLPVSSHAQAPSPASPQNALPHSVSPGRGPAPISPSNATVPPAPALPLPQQGAAAPPASQTVAALGPPPHVEWRNNQLSVRADDYPLSRIIQHVAHIADVDVVGLDKINGRASISFASQNLPQAFDLLLPGWDYAFAQPNPSLGRRGQLMILARGGAVPDLPKPAPAVAPGPAGKGADDDDWDDNSPEEQAAITKLKQAAARGDQQTLKTAITNPDSQIQQNAFDLLKAIDLQAAIDALLPATSSTDAQVAVQSLALLQRSGADPDTILNALGQSMDSSVASVKAYAVQSLPNYGQDSLRFMLQAMSDPDRNIRLSVLQAAARFPWASSIVQQAASDQDQQVRDMAAQFLHQQEQQAQALQAQQDQSAAQPSPGQTIQVQPNQPGQNPQTIAGQPDSPQDSDSNSDADQSTPDDDNSDTPK